MKLTGRQRHFLENFLDFYQGESQPLHYAQVADRLGIGKVTAYDMLRLLETKELVRSEYILPEGRTGAGRSSIVFFPTSKAVQVLRELAGENWEAGAWEEIKESILRSLREEKGESYEDLLEEILLRLDKQNFPLVTVAEMVTAVILSLRQFQHSVSANGGLAERLKSIGFPGELSLEALGGLAVGLSFAEAFNRKLINRLLRYMHTYQTNLFNLDGRSRQRLAEFAQEVWRLTEP